jgi:hypothetical protein
MTVSPGDRIQDTVKRFGCQWFLVDLAGQQKGQTLDFTRIVAIIELVWISYW